MLFLEIAAATALIAAGWLLLRLAATRLVDRPNLRQLAARLLPDSPSLPYAVGALLGTLATASVLANYLLFWYRTPLIKAALLISVFPLVACAAGALFQAIATALLKRTSVTKVVGLWAFLFIFLIALLSTLTTWRAVLPAGAIDPNYELRFSRAASELASESPVELLEIKLTSALGNSRPMKLDYAVCTANPMHGWVQNALVAATATAEPDLVCAFQAQPGDYIEMLLSSSTGAPELTIQVNDVVYTQISVENNIRFVPILLPHTANSIFVTLIENTARLAAPGLLLFILISLVIERNWLSTSATALVVFAVVCLSILVRNAWVVEDQFITMRVIENLVHGYGPNFNVGYRVQAFTHPLWMLLLAAIYFLANQILPAADVSSLYYITAATSLLLTALTFSILLGSNKKNFATAFLGATLLLLSKSFVDYSLSGLENALLNVLLLAFLASIHAIDSDKKTLLWPFLLASCIVITRQDALLLVLPALLYLSWQRLPRLREFSSAALGLFPVIAWQTFSLIYYGFLVPNTAFAKLNTGIPREDLIEQGLAYYANAIRWDLLALVAIAFTLILVLYHRNWRQIAVGLGISAYLAYVVWIGGDFMSGRFLVAPLVMAVGLLVIGLPRYKLTLPVLIAIAVLGLLNERSPLYANLNYGQTFAIEDRFDSQIADERAVFFAQTALLRNTPGEGIAANVWNAWQVSAEFPADVLEMGSIGIPGYLQGPDYILIDRYALADPLLSKLPAAYQPQGWRIGHFARLTPAGYRETLLENKNLIADSNLATYWDALQQVVQGELWSTQRFITIWKMNSGHYQYLLDAYSEP